MTETDMTDISGRAGHRRLFRLASPRSLALRSGPISGTMRSTGPAFSGAALSIMAATACRTTDGKRRISYPEAGPYRFAKDLGPQRRATPDGANPLEEGQGVHSLLCPPSRALQGAFGRPRSRDLPGGSGWGEAS